MRPEYQDKRIGSFDRHISQLCDGCRVLIGWDLSLDFFLFCLFGSIVVLLFLNFWSLNFLLVHDTVLTRQVESKNYKYINPKLKSSCKTKSLFSFGKKT